MDNNGVGMTTNDQQVEIHLLPHHCQVEVRNLHKLTVACSLSFK